ncbi:MAG TPA: MlaD family protein [Candidatus Binatia bacterium]|jgi:phospholipid/cholesterol/gamma-HCH transport system substrate-binding protein|nr:MlaD family protein [Candidatus Binatia bacterium]
MLTNEQRIGLFFIVGVVLLFVAVELTLGVGILRRRYTLYATFRDVQGLDTGADVRLAGIKAGRVAGMRIEDGHVRVALAIDGGLVVKKDSVATLDFRALSGERFVSLSLGTPSAKPAEPGDVLEGETPASFTDVVNQLSSVASSVNDLVTNLNDSSSRLLGGLADLVERNRTALSDVAGNLASITTKLDRGTGTLGLLLNDPKLYDRVTETMGDVRQSVQDLGRVAHDLADGRGTLGKLLTQDDGLYGQVRETMDDLSETARNAQEITQSLRAGEGTIGKALTDDALYTEAEDTLRTVNRATQSVEDQAPLSILGTIVTSLF